MGNQGSTQKVTRTIHIGQSNNEEFPDNRVISSKYTLLSFLPKNLCEQFRRFANICFVAITLINLFAKGPVNPVVYVFPICLIMGATAIKQAYEDYCRHLADARVNMTSVRVLRQGCLVDIPCKHVHVGDIVCLHSEEDVPCDLAILLTSQQDGKCFVTTANLDGETNLKVMEQPVGFNIMLDNVGTLNGVIVCEDPTPNLYSFTGYIEIENRGNNVDTTEEHHNGFDNKGYENSDHVLELSSLSVNLSDQETFKKEVTKKAPLLAENVLLRGSRLKTTNYVYGCAVYTGQETKLSLNSRLSKNKFSTVERTINWFLLFFFCLLITEAFVSSACEWFYMDNTNKFFFLGPPETLNIPLDIFHYIVLYYYIIPTSMYITIELQRFLGTVFFESDIEMYQKGKRAICNTSDLNEELGQVKYVFTDKTGTLTENEMEFQRCSVNGRMYYEEEGKLYMLPNSGNSYGAEPVPSNNWSTGLKQFFLALALCHTVQCDRQSYPVQYQASSTDEKAFVEACARCDVVFLGMVNDSYRIKMKGEVKMFKKLEVLQFTSERKRMSVIVRDESDTIWLFCKGAELSLLPLISEGFSDEDNKHLQDFSSRGLRTLVFGCRQLTLNEFNEGMQNLLEARSTLDHDIKQELINAACLYFESGLQMLGITAVEDRLQEYVPETLASLYAAGIKVWVLTGDKVETAKSIAYSCGHFKNGTDIINLIGLNSLDLYLENLDHFRLKVTTERYKQFGLVIDGTTLSVILGHDPQPFIELAMSCSAVVCCRLSPKQKAQIIYLVKHSKKKPTTLAIGDGANDVSMIQEAHIGIGIMGKEGQQAVHCSDFAFAQFHCLARALLVHGHWYYLRAANLILYFFYKNIVFITPQVYFAFGMSPQVLYCALFLLLYNTLFTAVPIIVYGLVEQDLPDKTLTSYPSLYKNFRSNRLMSWKNFILWILFGVWHSIVIYFVPCLSISLIFYDTDIDLITFGTAVLHFAIFIVNLKLLVHSEYWTVMFILSIVGSILGFFGFTILYSIFFGIFETNEVDIKEMYGIHLNLYFSSWFWSTLVFCIITSLLPDVIYCHIKKSGIELDSMKPRCLMTRSSFRFDDTYDKRQHVPGV